MRTQIDDVFLRQQKERITSHLTRYYGMARPDNTVDSPERIAFKLQTIVPRLLDALKAINAGTYGICSDCEDPIPHARLKAIPGATRCVSCQATFEGRSS